MAINNKQILKIKIPRSSEGLISSRDKKVQSNQIIERKRKEKPISAIIQKPISKVNGEKDDGLHKSKNSV